jgi:hypothetical protein
VVAVEPDDPMGPHPHFVRIGPASGGGLDRSAHQGISIAKVTTSGEDAFMSLLDQNSTLGKISAIDLP